MSDGDPKVLGERLNPIPLLRRLVIASILLMPAATCFVLWKGRSLQGNDPAFSLITIAFVGGCIGGIAGFIWGTVYDRVGLILLSLAALIINAWAIVGWQYFMGVMQG